MSSIKCSLCALGVLSLAAAAQAELVNVDVRGTVDFNVIQGNLTGIPSGTPVKMTFNVDSNNFLNSASFPTRGYVIDLSSWSMLVGSAPIPITNPQPGGSTAYFVLRNNDPAVDGFFISPGVDLDFPIGVNIVGLTQQHDLEFSRTFNDGTPLTSLNILDAVGTYGLANISSFNWGVGRFGNQGLGLNYESITISVVPEPAMVMLFPLAAMLRRRRARSE